MLQNVATFYRHAKSPTIGIDHLASKIRTERSSAGILPAALRINRAEKTPARRRRHEANAVLMIELMEKRVSGQTYFAFTSNGSFNLK